MTAGGATWGTPLDLAIRDFHTVLATGDLTAPVPSCPGWSLADLGNHLRSVHLWAAHAVTEGNPEGTSEPVAPERLADAYVAAGTHLLQVLPEDGDTPTWTFGTDKTAAFWWRRQFHETRLHLYDALLSQGHESSWTIPAELAWDGVDEVATVFYPRQVRRGRVEPIPGALQVTATDLDRSITIGEGSPALRLNAPAADLLLTLWKRIPSTDRDVAALLTTAITP